MMSAYLPVYGHAVGLSASVIGIVVAMNASAAFVSRALLPQMIAILKEKKVMALSFTFGAVALLLIPFFENAVALGMLAFMFGLGMGAGQPVVTMLIFQYSPAGRSGEGIGLKMTTNQLTKLVSPIAFGAVASAVGLLPMFWLNALLLGSGGWMARPKRK
jgi:MFS family permease